MDPRSRRGFYWPAAVIWTLIAIGAVASALTMLAAIVWFFVAVVWPALTLDLIAPTAAQVLDPGFSLEATMAWAQEEP